MESTTHPTGAAGMRSSATYVSCAERTQADKTSSAVVGTGRRGGRIERRFVVALTSASGVRRAWQTSASRQQPAGPTPGPAGVFGYSGAGAILTTSVLGPLLGAGLVQWISPLRPAPAFESVM